MHPAPSAQTRSLTKRRSTRDTDTGIRSQTLAPSCLVIHVTRASSNCNNRPATVSVAQPRTKEESHLRSRRIGCSVLRNRPRPRSLQSSRRCSQSVIHADVYYTGRIRGDRGFLFALMTRSRAPALPARPARPGVLPAVPMRGPGLRTPDRQAGSRLD